MPQEDQMGNLLLNLEAGRSTEDWEKESRRGRDRHERNGMAGRQNLHPGEVVPVSPYRRIRHIPGGPDPPDPGCDPGRGRGNSIGMMRATKGGTKAVVILRIRKATAGEDRVENLKREIV